VSTLLLLPNVIVQNFLGIRFRLFKALGRHKAIEESVEPQDVRFIALDSFKRDTEINLGDGVDQTLPVVTNQYCPRPGRHFVGGFFQQQPKGLVHLCGCNHEDPASDGFAI
jgi:hypothetical protein